MGQANNAAAVYVTNKLHNRHNLHVLHYKEELCSCHICDPTGITYIQQNNSFLAKTLVIVVSLF
jgi:hypothetical protein